jgi:hypothetical protein
MTNDDARLQDPILLLKIPMGKRNNFAENYRQFEHVLSKRFANPDLGGCGELGTQPHGKEKCSCLKG